MPDAPDAAPASPSASARLPTPQTDSPRRPGTILGRLSKAVREQNWVAVGLEVVIVIVGVVIGFQVTAWGQARADRAMEQTYLRQLRGDLLETEGLLAEADSLLAPVETAGTAIVRSFYQPVRPSRDSLLARLMGASSLVPVSAVTGTADALVATGDLTLVRDDTLRAEITSYIGQAETFAETSRQFQALWLESFRDLYRERDMVEQVFDAASPATIDSLARADPQFLLPVGARRSPFPLQVDAFLSDPANLASAMGLRLAQENLHEGRQTLRAETAALRERVEARIDP